jgi:membrane-associated HD superfamily phosphohydrolase
LVFIVGINRQAQVGFVSLSPSDEAKELRAHVADGLELAARHRLGQPVLEIIAQHHGMSVVRNAYRRALDMQPQGSTGVDLADYVYSGSKPLSREAGLVMLADVVEMASRDLAVESALEVSTIEATVRRAVTDVVAEGQLEACGLTLQDMSIIIREFTLVLEDRLIRRGRLTLSGLPRIHAAKVVRPPLGGELN